MRFYHSTVNLYSLKMKIYPLSHCILSHRKYGLKIIIDLHAAPGSQNGFEHSSSRDGSQEWGLTDDNIQQTVAVLDFLTARSNKYTAFQIS